MQGIDGSARKPALRQDTEYMVEKTYHLATYLDPLVGGTYQKFSVSAVIICGP